MSVASLFSGPLVSPERPSQDVTPAFRLLVAAEEPEVVEALRIVSRNEGLAMSAAPSAAGLLEAALGEHDVALVDLGCIGAGPASRLDVIAQLQAIDPTLPIVVMTPWGSVDLAVEAVRGGARDYVQKPWDTPRLVTTLHREAAYGATLRRVRQLEAEAARVVPLEDVEKDAIRRALAHTRGNVVQAAVALGLSRSAMYRRLQAYGIRSG